MAVNKANTFTASTTILSAEVNENFDDLYETSGLGLKNYDAEHNTDGTHAAVTVTSLVDSGTATFTGAVTASSTLTAKGAVVACSTLRISGAVTASSTITAKGNVTVSANILADADGTRDIGASATRFGNVYADNINGTPASPSVFSTANNYTITDTDGYTLILCTATATITLPTLADNQNRIITIKNDGQNDLTIDGEGAEAIDGATTQILYEDNDFITILGQSSEWKIINQNKSRRIQEKTLSADSGTSETMSDLTVSDLTVGRTYTVNLYVDMIVDGGDDLLVTITHNGSNIGRVGYEHNGDTTDDFVGQFISTTFVAAATSVTFVSANNDNAGTAVRGNGTKNETWVQVIEEPNDAVVVSAF